MKLFVSFIITLIALVAWFGSGLVEATPACPPGSRIVFSNGKIRCESIKKWQIQKVADFKVAEKERVGEVEEQKTKVTQTKEKQQDEENVAATSSTQAPMTATEKQEAPPSTEANMTEEKPESIAGSEERSATGSAQFQSSTQAPTTAQATTSRWRSWMSFGRRLCGCFVFAEDCVHYWDIPRSN